MSQRASISIVKSAEPQGRSNKEINPYRIKLAPLHFSQPPRKREALVGAGLSMRGCGVFSVWGSIWVRMGKAFEFDTYDGGGGLLLDPEDGF